MDYHFEQCFEQDEKLPCICETLEEHAQYVYEMSLENEATGN